MRIRFLALSGLALVGILGAPSMAQTSSQGSFITQESADQWRASKLVGLNVYSPDNAKIGTIREIILDRNGSAEAAVIGVGGFLGVGEKDVAVPFKSIRWSDERVGASNNRATTGTNINGNPPKTVYRGYPDHGLLSMTKDELKNAPAFHFAGDTSARDRTNNPRPNRNQ